MIKTIIKVLKEIKPDPSHFEGDDWDIAIGLWFKLIVVFSRYLERYKNFDPVKFRQDIFKN